MPRPIPQINAGKIVVTIFPLAHIKTDDGLTAARFEPECLRPGPRLLLLGGRDLLINFVSIFNIELRVMPPKDQSAAEA